MVDLARKEGRLENDEGTVDMLRLPRKLLRDLWDRAFTGILKKIKALRKKEVEAASKKGIEALCQGTDVFVSLHACYYHVKTSEFFTVVDEKLLGMFSADVVINLIDDLYDVFARLSGSGQLFDRTYAVGKGVEASLKHFGHLSQILQWRSVETLLTDHLAEGAFHTIRPSVLAVKHPLTVARQLIYSPGNHSIYLSHPISEPRRMEITHRVVEADGFIGEVNQVADALRQDAIVFEPTTIDELRILQVADPDDASITQRVPKLLRRWRLAEAAFLLYAPPPVVENPLDPTGVFDGLSEAEMASMIFRRTGDAKQEGDTEKLRRFLVASDLAEALSKQISLHIKARDHRLVEQSDSVVVYRPVFAGNAADGVRIEIKYYRELARYGLQKNDGRVAVLTLPEDIAGYRRTLIVSYLKGLSWDGGMTPNERETLIEEAARGGAKFSGTAEAKEFFTHVRTTLAAGGLTLAVTNGSVLGDEAAGQLSDAEQAHAIRLAQIAGEEEPPYVRFLDDADCTELRELMSPIEFANRIKGELGIG